MRRVMEGAQHAREVRKGRSLEAPLAQGARRLALEVDDRDVAAGVEDLAEVQVAVDADALSADAGLGAGAWRLRFPALPSPSQREARGAVALGQGPS